MTPLRRQMIEDMKLRGFAENTQRTYLDAVRRLTEHCHKPPDQISEEELRRFFLYLIDEKGAARSTFITTWHGVKFFFQQCLQQEWPLLEMAGPPKEKKLRRWQTKIDVVFQLKGRLIQLLKAIEQMF